MEWLWMWYTEHENHQQHSVRLAELAADIFPQTLTERAKRSRGKAHEADSEQDTSAIRTWRTNDGTANARRGAIRENCLIGHLWVVLSGRRVACGTTQTWYSRWVVSIGALNSGWKHGRGLAADERKAAECGQE